MPIFKVVKKNTTSYIYDVDCDKLDEVISCWNQGYGILIKTKEETSDPIIMDVKYIIQPLDKP